MERFQVVKSPLNIYTETRGNMENTAQIREMYHLKVYHQRGKGDMELGSMGQDHHSNSCGRSGTFSISR